MFRSLSFNCSDYYQRFDNCLEKDYLVENNRHGLGTDGVRQSKIIPHNSMSVWLLLFKSSSKVPYFYFKRPLL